MPRHKTHDFEIIPDLDERYAAVKQEVDYFLRTHLRDMADDGRIDTAKSICMDLVNMLSSTYNEIDAEYVRAI